MELNLGSEANNILQCGVFVSGYPFLTRDV